MNFALKLNNLTLGDIKLESVEINIEMSDEAYQNGQNVLAKALSDISKLYMEASK